MSAAAKRTSLVVITLGLAGVMFLAGAAGGAPRKGDRVAPSTPTNLHVAGATSTAVAVAWDGSSDNVGVVGYYVWAGSKRTAVSSTSYTGTGLTCGQSVTVSVAAFDRAGNRSNRVTATVASAACADSQAPTVPTGFSQAATTQTAVVLTWAPSQDNVGVIGYGVYQSLVRTASPTQSTVTLSGLTCDSVYTYGVDAADAAGNRSALGTAFVQTAACSDVQPPSAPANLTVTARTQQSVSLSWSPSTDDVGVAGYRISVARILVQTVEQTSATVELSCGTSYVLGVEAYDAVGHVSQAATTNASTDACPTSTPPPPSQLPPDTSPPSAPTGLAASNITQTSLGLNWNAATDNVGVAGYDVYRNGSKVASVTSTSLSQASLTCGSAYAYGVVAYDAAGNRSQEAQLGVATSACSAPAPSDTAAPSTPTGLAASNITQTSLGLNWNAATDNVGVAGYDVYRNGAKVASVNSTSLGQSGLMCGTGYAFGVVAYDAAGNRSLQAQMNVATSSCSAPPPPSADPTPPSQPTSLAVSSATGTGVSLTWAASTDNVAVTGYRVYVNGSAGPTSTQPGAIASGLTCGTAYTFEVDAYDAAGNRSTKASVVGSTSPCADTQPPSAPTNVVATLRTATSIALSWTASTDNVGVSGYGLYRGGTQTGTATTTSAIFSGLNCNSMYTLAVGAYDAAGNRSSQTALLISTTACPDATPPSAPTNLASSAISATGLTLTWNASTDNVGVSGYDVYRNGTKMATVTTTSSSQTGLACSTSYSFAVEAIDAAGNRSPQAQLSTSTTACSSPPPASNGCTQTISNGLQAAIQNASAGATICLNNGSYGAITLSGVTKANTVTVQPSTGATATIGLLRWNNVDHIRFTGTGGTMNIAGMEIDSSYYSGGGGSDHLTFDHIRYTAGMDIWTYGSSTTANVLDSLTLNGLGTSPEDNEGRVTFRGTNEATQSGWTISNSSFIGGCSDGVQIIGNARGVHVGPGNEFANIQQSGCGTVHADPIQFYGATETLVTGNYFHDNGDGSGGIMSSDGNGSSATVTNNVFVCTCVYPYSIATTGERNWTVQHNTFAGGGVLRFTNGGSGNHAFDNTWTSGGGIQGSGYTNDHNLNSGQAGTGNLLGTPVFFGGANPSTYNGFLLASGSPGKGAASDGSDIGIR